MDYLENHVMIFIMILSGFLATMNMWAYKWSDVRISANDIYMVFLMIGWMYLFMGLYYGVKQHVLLGAVLVVLFFIAIRKQLFVSSNQFVKGMIPHHSMAILMSKRLLEKGNTDSKLEKIAHDIINNQENEIKLFKELEN